MDDRTSALQGCLLGMAVGDALGLPVDKKSWDEICQDYGPYGLLGYDLVNGSADVSSYTQISAFVANSLLLGAIRGNPDNYPKFLALGLREWARSQQVRSGEKTFCWLSHISALRRRHCMDTRMLDALSREQLGTPAKPVLYSETPCALTAAIPVGLIYDSERMPPRQIGILGTQAIACTHGDPETFLAGAFLAYSIAAILRSPDQPLAKLYAVAAEAVQTQFGETYDAAESLAARIHRAIALTKDPELSPLAAMSILSCTTAAECVAGAVYATVIHAANFDEGLIAAVNHSGRSAAVAALTGALLGARLGVEALPEFYLESLEVAPVLAELAEDLSQSKSCARIFDDSWDQKYVQGHPAT